MLNMSTDGYTRITLRIPEELHAKLTAEAARTSKSMNAEIIHRLEQSFRTDLQPIPRDNAKELRTIIERLDNQTREIAAIRTRIFESEFSRIHAELLAKGVPRDTAFREALEQAEATSKID